MRRVSRAVLLPLVAVLALVAASCSKDDGSSGGDGGGGGGISITLADYSVAADPATANAGDITFDIHNDAGQVHEFVVFKSDLDEGSLPTDDTGDVDEAGKGVEHIDEVEDIEGGADGTLAVNLAAGNYVLICNLPGHYGQGMHASFTVA